MNKSQKSVLLFLTIPVPVRELRIVTGVDLINLEQLATLETQERPSSTAENII